jgi:hypothetical protein
MPGWPARLNPVGAGLRCMAGLQCVMVNTLTITPEPPLWPNQLCAQTAESATGSPSDNVLCPTVEGDDDGLVLPAAPPREAGEDEVEPGPRGRAHSPPGKKVPDAQTASAIK